MTLRVLGRVSSINVRKVHRWLLSPIERPHLDAVHGYYQRLSVRPAFRAHVAADVP